MSNVLYVTKKTNLDSIFLIANSIDKEVIIVSNNIKELSNSYDKYRKRRCYITTKFDKPIIYDNSISFNYDGGKIVTFTSRIEVEDYYDDVFIIMVE